MSTRHIAILKVPIDIYQNGDFKIYEDDLEFYFEEDIENKKDLEIIQYQPPITTNLEIVDTYMITNEPNDIVVKEPIVLIDDPPTINEIPPSTQENIISEMFNLFVDKSEIKTETKKRMNSSLKNKSNHRKHHYRYSMKAQPGSFKKS